MTVGQKVNLQCVYFRLFTPNFNRNTCSIIVLPSHHFPHTSDHNPGISLLLHEIFHSLLIEVPIVCTSMHVNSCWKCAASFNFVATSVLL